MQLAFLAPLLDRPGPWASVVLDTAHTTEDAARRQDLLDRTAVRRLAALGADEPTCAAVRDHLAAEPASGAPPGRALFATDGEVVLDVPLSGPPPDVEASWSALPHTSRLLGLLDDHAAACLVAFIDRTGADLEVREPGRADRLGSVAGPQWQGRGPHRAPPGDRSDWHYRHRREDGWERTAGVIADELARRWPESGARLLVLTGDARERRAVHDRLPHQLRAEAVEVDGGGRAGGIAAEAFDRQLARAWQEHRQRRLDAALADFRAGLGRPGEHTTDGDGTEAAPGAAAQGVPAVVAAARQHRVATLLIQQGAADAERRVWVGPEPEHVAVQRGEVRTMGADAAQSAPAADALLRCAAATGAEALLVPAGAAGPAGGVGAVLRWQP